jgi:hypothetical protein
MSSSLIVDDDRSTRGAPVGEPEPHLPFDSRAVEAPHVHRRLRGLDGCAALCEAPWLRAP